MRLLAAFALTSLGWAADDLGTWSARTGVPLATDGVQVNPLPDGLALVGAGISLRLSAGTGADQVVARELEVFRTGGMQVSEIEDVACTVAGVDATCKKAVVSFGPGATMTLLGGAPAGGGWAAVCLDRKGQLGGPCAGVLALR